MSFMRLVRFVRLGRSKPVIFSHQNTQQACSNRVASGLQEQRRISQIVSFVTFLFALICVHLGFAYAQADPAATAPMLSKNALKAGQPPRQWVTPAAGDVQKGAALYQSRCTACHAIDSNQTGPAHRGVMGRRVGSLPGYSYSAELAKSRLRWTPQTLNVWLEDPEELIAGQRMGFQVDDAKERADLIAYLATLK